MYGQVLNQHVHPAGFIAYLSAVRVDAAYNNPVMNVFVYLLIEAKKAKKKSGKQLESFSYF